MRKMNKEEKKIIENEIRMIMQNAASSDYARYILEHENENDKTFMEDVIEDIVETSAWEDEGYYNEDDIRLAIGRVLITRLGINY